MNVERAWIATCTRCKAEGFAYVATRLAAVNDLREQGWTSEYPRTYCRLCNAESK